MKSFTPVRWVVLLTVLLNLLSWNAQMAMWRDPRTLDRPAEWGYSSAKIEWRDYMFDTHAAALFITCFTLCAIVYLAVAFLERNKQ